MDVMQIQNGAVETLGGETLRPQRASTTPNVVEAEQPYFNGLDARAQRTRNVGGVADFEAVVP